MVGFTGHEHLSQFGLINMNGRVYDPLVSRFLSPDLFVQAPGNSQSFNRYAYVFNNPLSFIDPSGYSSITLTGFGAQQFWAWYLGQHNSEGTPGIDMSFGMMTALGGSGSSYGGSSLSGGSSSSWTSFNWYNWDKNKSFWKNLRENFNRGFRGRLGDGRELVGLERNRSFDPTNFDFYSHFGDMKDHPPIIFVELFNRPAGFKEQEYLNSLKERLVENGFNQNLKVVRSSIKWRFKSWLYGLPSATITFRPFQVKDISLAFESGGLVAGFAQYYSNKAVVYPGLNYSSALRDRVFSTNWYVMATMHELGHAIFGFKHTNQGIMQPKLIDPYLNFLPWQQEIIRKSIWGQ